MSLDHFLFRVPHSKLDGLVTFLETSLQHMNFKALMRPAPHVVGMGVTHHYLWVVGAGPDELDEKELEKQLKATHIAFTAKNAEEVQKFHALGLQAGGTDNGKPGRRPHYNPPGYYAAFVRDPGCGINFEVVFRATPEEDEALKKLEEQQ